MILRLCALVVVLAAVGRYGNALLSQKSSSYHNIRKTQSVVFKTSTSAFSPPLHNKLCLHHSSAVVEREGTTISTDDNLTCGNTTIISDQNDYNEQLLVKELGRAFSQRYIELQEYKHLHGDCMVPKRYKNNPSLGNWVNKQRQNYRRFVKGEKTSMNEVCVVCILCLMGKHFALCTYIHL